MAATRIDFETAALDKRLLRSAFAQLSVAQRTLLRSIYGSPLSCKEDEFGITPQQYWAAQQGYGLYDYLGNLTGVRPDAPAYSARTYREAWIIAGVRSGKSHVATFIAAYEALCGGHEARTSRGKPAIIFLVSQDSRQARYNLRAIDDILTDSPIGRQLRVTKTADRIDLSHGITVAVIPPIVKAIRGYDSPVGIMDEVAVWAQDIEAANPDGAVYSQIASRQAQFTNPLIVGISSPWNKGGLLYQRYSAGTAGVKVWCGDCRSRDCSRCVRLRKPSRNFFVAHATTASLRNPLVEAEWLERKFDENPEVFARECLAEFSDAVSAFLPVAVIEAAIDRGVVERKPVEGRVKPFYVAAMDPAFRADRFAFGVGHMDERGVFVEDVLRVWRPTPGAPLSPRAVLQEITPLLTAYGINAVGSDQTHFESLSQLALDCGWTIIPMPFSRSSKPRFYGNLQQLLLQHRVKLLDRPDANTELKRLERILQRAGHVTIAAPKGEKDDTADMRALLMEQAVRLAPLITESETKRTPEDEHWERALQRDRDSRSTDDEHAFDDLYSSIS